MHGLDHGARPHADVDVCVMGGGPAGSVFAARAAQLGYSVLLVERAVFPRAHLGESLTAGVLPMLDTIGARARVEEAGFTRVRSVRTSWDHALTERIDVQESGLLVDRGRFDALLLARARELGVQVRQPAVVRAMTAHADGWALQIESATAREPSSVSLRARFLVDATGRHGLLAVRRRRTGPSTLALYGYWRGRTLPTRPCIEAGRDAWYWGVPLPDGSYNTLAFVDSGSVRAATSRSLEAQFRALLVRSGLMEECRDAHLVGRVRAADATPYVDEASVSETSVKVGDAALAIDPLSSSGVQKAIQTALSAVIVMNTVLRQRGNAGAAMQFYREHLAQASDRHRGWAASHYAAVAARETDPFWQARSAGAAPSDARTSDARAPSMMGTSATFDGAVPIATSSAAHIATHIATQIASRDPVQVAPDVELVEIPRLGAEFVEVGAALRHPSLDAPVAYVGGWELAPLLQAMRPGMTPMEAVRSWAPAVPVRAGIAVAGWLLRHGILVNRTCSSF